MSSCSFRLYCRFLSCPSGSNDTLCVTWGEPWSVCSFFGYLFRTPIPPAYIPPVSTSMRKSRCLIQASVTPGLTLISKASLLDVDWLLALGSRTVWVPAAPDFFSCSLINRPSISHPALGYLHRVDTGETTGLWWWQFLEFLPDFNIKLSQSNCAILH